MFWSGGLAVFWRVVQNIRIGVFEGKMEELVGSPLNKKKKTMEGVAVAQKVVFNEQDSDKKQQGNGEEVNSSEAEDKSAAKTSGKTDVRFDRFKLFDKVMQKSLEKYVEIARYVSFSHFFSVTLRHVPSGCIWSIELVNTNNVYI